MRMSHERRSTQGEIVPRRHQFVKVTNRHGWARREFRNKHAHTRERDIAQLAAALRPMHNKCMKRDAQPTQRTKSPVLKGSETLMPPKTSPAPSGSEPAFMRRGDGKLAVTPAGLQKLRRTFLGSPSLSDSPVADNSSLERALLGQAAGTIPFSAGDCNTPASMNFALEAVASLDPRDGLEVMLCSQLAALHSQSMEFMRRGMLPEQTSDGVDCNVNRATKLLRTFAILAECLRTHRGGGQQKVTVEHVTVQAGGQAIVGTVNRGVGGGDAQQTRE